MRPADARRTRDAPVGTVAAADVSAQHQAAVATEELGAPGPVAQGQVVGVRDGGGDDGGGGGGGGGSGGGGGGGGRGGGGHEPVAAARRQRRTVHRKLILQSAPLLVQESRCSTNMGNDMSVL